MQEAATKAGSRFRGIDAVKGSCPACRSARSKGAMSIREYTFQRCADCRSLFVADPPPPSRLRDLYADESYFANPAFGSPEDDGYHGYLRYIEDQAHIEGKFRTVLTCAEQWVRPGTLLDVGAGPGFLLDAARRRGWKGKGLEINGWAAEYAREHLDLAVSQQTLEEASAKTGSYDLVTMMDLIEHMIDPDATIAEARRIVRDGGMLCLLTPDAGSPVSRMFGRRWPEVVRVPEHLVLFSVDGMKQMLARHGFETVHWHWIGKESSIATLVADVTPIHPPSGRRLQGVAERFSWGRRTFELNPRTKFCLYARAT